MNVVAIIQARMGSSRLPGKILMDLAGEPMLARVVRRVGRAGAVNRVVVATTTEPADDAVAELCVARGWECTRGSQDDVLDRYYQAACQAGADVVVRITSDCPLIDPCVVDAVVRSLLQRQPGIQFASNTSPVRTFPRGLDTEVFTFAALQTAWQEDRNPATREHVTPYIYRYPERFGLYCLTWPVDESVHRWTVDAAEDLDIVRRIYRCFENDAFSWQDALRVCADHPEWLELNRKVPQKEVI